MAKDFLLTPSAGATSTNRRKKGKKKPTKKQPPDTASEGTAANLPQPFGKAPHCSGHHKEAQQCSGESPQTQRASRWSLPEVPDAVPGTLLRLRLCRSTLPLWAQFSSCRRAPGGTFSGSLRLILAQALCARPGVAAIRVNQKRNIVAADAITRECLEQLLTIKELKGIRVTAKEPADHRTSTGFLHGVDGEPAADGLLPGIQSAVPVLSAAREGRTVTLRFAGPVPPEHVSLFLVRFPVRPARLRPLQCRQCSRFGHVKESCSWPGSCIRCSRTHPEESCKQTRPRGSGGARGDSGGADLSERGEGPPFTMLATFTTPPSGQTHPWRLANLVSSHSRDSIPLALLPLWPCRRPLLFLRPRLLQLLLSRPSLLLLSLQASLLYPRLLWPRLL
ncbi:hypothetical protein MRX96_034284 [Rhipicephalus microplus]